MRRHSLALIALALVPACEEGGADAAPAEAPAAPVEAAAAPAPAPPGFDVDAARKQLLDYTYIGVVGGRPVFFFVKDAGGGRLAGGLCMDAASMQEVDTKKIVSVAIDVQPDGKVRMNTAEKPVQRGMQTTEYYGQFAPDLSALQGTTSEVLKAGFVEESTDGPTWTLKRDRSRADLDAEAAKAPPSKGKGKGKTKRKGGK